MLAMLQEWAAYAQTKTARHKLTKFLKDHGHLLEEQPIEAQPEESSSASEAASANGAGGASFKDVQVGNLTFFYPLLSCPQSGFPANSQPVPNDKWLHGQFGMCKSEAASRQEGEALLTVRKDTYVHEV